MDNNYRDEPKLAHNVVMKLIEVMKEKNVIL